MRKLAIVALMALALPEAAACREFSLPSGRTAADVFVQAEPLNLARAACRGDRAEVATLVENGADPNDTGKEGVTVLAWALACDNTEGVEALLKAGADPNKLVGGKVPPAFFTVSRKTASLQILLKYGADPDGVDEEGDDSLLMAAVQHAAAGGGWENFNLLIHSGANINFSPTGISTVATVAAGLVQYDKVVELLDLGYNYRLDYLGLLIQTPDEPSQEIFRRKAVTILKSRGVIFPVKRPGE
jgi:ankyrin repeat protein